MASVNKAILVGHLGRDPEIRRTSADDPVATFRLATSETWKDKATGERKERTEWHSVVVFNENACRAAEKYLKKGSRVYVEGQLQTRKWQDQAGQDRYSTEVVITRFRGELVLLDRAERQAPSPDDYGRTRSSEFGRKPQGDPGGAGARPDLDDDIPF